MIFNLGWPTVRAYFNAMIQHHQAASLLLRECPFPSSTLLAAEVIYVGGYAVECGLKAVLFSKVRLRRHKQLAIEVKKRIGHDLEKLQSRLASLRKPFLMDGKELRAFHHVRGSWNTEDRYLGIRKPSALASDFQLAVNTIVESLIYYES